MLEGFRMRRRFSRVVSRVFLAGLLLVLLCRSSELCDADVLDGYFGLYAERFVCLYLPMIQDIRRDTQSDDFAHRLTDYVAARGGCVAGDAGSPAGEG